MSSSLFADTSSVLERLLGPRAVLDISLGRDQSDNYAVRTTPPRSTGPTQIPSATEILQLLPTGSTWSPALGWRSIVGLPIFLKDSRWLLLGVESAGGHQSRGAFALFRAFVFRLDQDIDRILREVGRALTLPRGGTSVSVPRCT